MNNSIDRKLMQREFRRVVYKSLRTIPKAWQPFQRLENYAEGMATMPKGMATMLKDMATMPKAWQPC